MNMLLSFLIACGGDTAETEEGCKYYGNGNRRRY